MARQIDHGATVCASVLVLAVADVLLFGHPKVSTPLMAVSPEIAIKLPMRIVVRQDVDGKEIGLLSYGRVNWAPQLGCSA